ncbi:hypothetical protein Bbelb_024850 [Branchiostoma belcheri]|nr:hypothetical protein Bbelb_024850 [Branchiostoma belcheri]
MCCELATCFTLVANCLAKVGLLNSTRALLTKRRRDLIVRTPRGTPPVASIPPGHISYVTDQMNRIKTMPAQLLNPAGASRGYIPDGHRRNWDHSLTGAVQKLIFVIKVENILAKQLMRYRVQARKPQEQRQAGTRRQGTKEKVKEKNGVEDGDSAVKTEMSVEKAKEETRTEGGANDTDITGKARRSRVETVTETEVDSTADRGENIGKQKRKGGEI